MCGIMGFYSFSGTKPDKDKITKMFSLLQTRGSDAAGFAFLSKDNNLVVHKAAVSSSDMVKTDEWKNLELPPIMILHTRMKTQGSEKNNFNNHPIFNKDGFALVHNGMVLNDRELFRNKNRDGEVDSEAILSVLTAKGKGDKIKSLFDKVDGCYAVAAIDRAEPERLTLIKHDNPIDLYYDSQDDILYFCSEREIMKEALGITPVSKRGFILGEKNFHFYEMENNYTLILNKNGIESYKKYHTSRRGYDKDWRGYGLGDEDDSICISEIECPHCYSQTPFDECSLRNECYWCGRDIFEEDIYNVL